MRTSGGGSRGNEWKLLERVWSVEADAVAGLSHTLEPVAVHACIDAIRRCRGRILTAGVGTSGAAARKIAHTLCCVGRSAFFLAPDDAPHGGLGAVRSEDVVILLSKGGRTREITALLDPLRAAGAYLIAVTEDPRSQLARRSDLVLRVRVPAEADPFGLLATTSTQVVLALFDAVAVALMRRTGWTRARFGAIHPGGAVGRKLGRV